jgi:hypothetical protein
MCLLTKLGYFGEEDNGSLESIGPLMKRLSIVEIRQWFKINKRRRELGESVPSVSAVAEKACLSRQTVYALLQDKRSEFGEVAQIRLSRVIQQISADPAYQQTRLMRLSLFLDGPRLHIGAR